MVTRKKTSTSQGKKPPRAISERATSTAATDVISDEELGAAPEGFQEVFGERVVGWFIPAAGNCIQGILRDVFETTSKFRRNRDDSGKRRVYKIEVTQAEPSLHGPTLYVPSDPDSEEETATGRPAKVGDLLGVDEKGWLKSLARVVVGQEVWIGCLGKKPPSAEYPQGAWQYRVLAKPVKVDEVTGEVHS